MNERKGENIFTARERKRELNGKRNRKTGAGKKQIHNLHNAEDT